MSELKKNFVQGKMNKDFDVRLIPEGEYIDAFNVLVSNSEGSQVGSIQNSFGIDQLSYLTLPSDAETIGSSSDEGGEKIYWFVATNSGSSYIFEYDQINGVVSTVLEDTRTAPNNVLNFNKQYKITGVNVIYNSFNKETLLVWTDDLNSIRCINVTRAKTYGPSNDSISTFLTQDISLYKRQPHFAPICTPTTTGDGVENNIKERFLSFGYRWKYLDGEYSSVSTFSNPQFYPGNFSLDYNTNENMGMVNRFNAVNIQFTTGDRNVTDVQLVFKESNSNSIWIIDTFNKKKMFWTNESTQSFLFSNNKIYHVLPQDEVNRLFDNVPIVAKAQDFIGSRLLYGNYVEGRDLIDSAGVKLNVDYDVSFKSENFSTTTINSSEITTTNNNDTISIDFTGSQINRGDILSISFKARSHDPFFGNYSFESFLFLDNAYANAAALQASSEFQNFITNVCSSNFVNYDTSSHVPPTNIETTYIPFEILPSTGPNVINVKIPSIKYKISLDPTYSYEMFYILQDSGFVTLSNGNSFSSCKSNRSYEVGIVYLDDEGRYSTVITNDHSNSTNNCFIPVINSVDKNTLVLKINHRPPYWASKYKIFVKDNKLDYQTLYGIIVYKDSNHLWIKLEGQDKNKVVDGDYLIVKRNTTSASQSLHKVQVLEYKQQPSDFIAGNTLTEKAGNYIKIKNGGGLYIDTETVPNSNNVHASASNESSGGVHLYLGLFSYLDPISNTYIDYKVTRGSRIDIYIQNEKLGDDGGFFSYGPKSYIATDDYNSFQEWFQTEADGLGVFSTFVWRRGFVASGNAGIEYIFNDDPAGALHLDVQGVMNGNGNHSSFMDGSIDIISSQGTIIFETDPKDKSSEVYYETPDTYLISNGNHLSNNNIIIDDIDQNGTTPATLNLSFFNCYTHGNGSESYIIKDLFSANFLSTQTRPNAVELDGYKERRNIASLTYSGGYEKTTNYNSLNEFNLSRANYKDLDDKYGTIQKIFSRDTDLIVFQEDKVHRVLYNKNLLSDAVGGGQITSVEDVLGQEVPFVGEWGIGTNPETFSNYANNLYFTDQPKGVALRLGSDGLEPISRYGMKDWFRDNLRDYSSKFIVGGFDPSYDNYILGFTEEPKDLHGLSIGCNQVVNGLVLTPGQSISYNINIGGKVGEYQFLYDIPVGELDITITIGEDVYENVNLSEGGEIDIPKRNTIEDAFVEIVNNSETISSSISFTNKCPETPKLEVITLVVNDEFDAGKSMKNQYIWTDSSYGYNGLSSNTDNFNSNGLTRFTTQTGFEADGPIPFEGSLVKVSSIKVSGEFTVCNKIGYVITSDDLDAAGVLADATYIPVTNVGDENYIEFTYTRADSSQKLYIVWDYIDNIYATANNLLKFIDIGGVLSINALDGITEVGAYSVSIETSPTFGYLDVSGDNITYHHTSETYEPDYFVYRVSIGDECYVDITINITINEIPIEDLPCYSYTIYAGEGIYNSVEYLDCYGESQMAIADGTLGSPVQETFCARQLIGPYNNVTTHHSICE